MLGIEADDAALATPGGARDLADRVAGRLGCARVALTRREVLGPREQAWSAVLLDTGSGALAQSRRHVVQVVDRVGGGDSFAAALIARLLEKDAPQDAVEFAAAAGAIKLGVPGDFCRIDAAQVERLLRAP
jgi:2-dehydro-3-deoxygluconokinase